MNHDLFSQIFDESDLPALLLKHPDQVAPEFVEMDMNRNMSQLTFKLGSKNDLMIYLGL